MRDAKFQMIGAMPEEQMAALTVGEPIVDLATKYALSSSCLFYAAKGPPALRSSRELPHAESFPGVHLRDSREFEGSKL